MLIIVGTPIGNLDDMSIRCANTILDAQYLLAEDTRSLQRLISHASTLLNKDKNINQKQISYYREVEYEKLPSIMKLLESDIDVVLVSEAGMPIISDPGSLLVKTCNARGVKVTVVPGPSSVDCAVALCGLPHDQFHFVGFFPKKASQLESLLKKLQEESTLHKNDVLFVAFESPERINATLELIATKFEKAQMVLCREITKMYEEVIINPKTTDTMKGEMVLCLKFQK